MKNIKIAIAVSVFLSSTALATTLPEALSSAYQNNPELIAAREQLKVTDEKMYMAISGFLPTIGYSAKKIYNKSDAYSSTSYHPASDSTITSNNKLDTWNKTKSKSSTIGLKQNIFQGGRTVMAVQIAKYTIEAGREELLSKEQKVLLDAVKAYLDVLQTKEILAINKENYESFAKKYESIKEEVAVGVKKNSDLANAAAHKANASTYLAKASGDYEGALATYLKVVGIPAENLNMGPDLLEVPANQMELLQNSLKSNPELLQVNYIKKSADINVISNAAALLPEVNVGGEIGKTWSHQQGRNNTQPYTNTKAVYISVDIPIYNQGVEFSKTRGASADAARLKYLAKNTQAEVTGNATKLWSNYIYSKEAVASSEEAVKAGIVALDGTQQAYEEGVASISDLLVSQENLFQYKIALANAKTNLAVSKYSLHSLMGKLNAKDLALPTKIYNPAANYDKVKLQLIGF
jgi:outer membrane protein